MVIRSLALAFAIASPALAQDPNCAPIAQAMDALASTYGEAPRVTALMTGGNMLMMTVGAGGGWTALEVKPDGMACIVAAGEAFEIQDAPAPGDPT